jgi:hypothetical protein
MAHKFVNVDTDDKRIRYTGGHWAQSDEDGLSSRITSDQSATVIFDFEGLAHLISLRFPVTLCLNRRRDYGRRVS